MFLAEVGAPAVEVLAALLAAERANQAAEPAEKPGSQGYVAGLREAVTDAPDVRGEAERLVDDQHPAPFGLLWEGDVGAAGAAANLHLETGVYDRPRAEADHPFSGDSHDCRRSRLSAGVECHVCRHRWQTLFAGLEQPADQRHDRIGRGENIGGREAE